VGLGVTTIGADADDDAEALPVLPYAGVVATGPGSESSPALGGGLHGVW
jgi:hypothetical protein